MSQNENLSLLARCLERIEDDWHRIEGDWGPTAGGLEGDIARGDETLIPELRAAVAACPSPWLPIDGAPKDGTVVRVYGCYLGATTPIEHLGWWSREFEEWIEQSSSVGHVLYRVTHWAPRGPIPPLPAGEDKPTDTVEGDRPNV